MKSLKKILSTPLEEMESLNADEFDLYANNFLREITPSSDYEKVNQHTYRFKVKDLLYQVEITESILLNTKKMIEIKFKLMNNPKAPKRSDFKTDRQHQVALQKSQVGITSTGSQVGITSTGSPNAVFARVIGIIIESVRDIQPDYISFTADEANRQSLYNRLINLIGKYSSIKYNRIITNPLSGEEAGAEEFWLEKST